jgi:dGTP triphosphohydrolase
MKQPLNEQFRRMQKLAGIITENQYNLQPIESILLTNVSPEEKMDKIGAYLTDTEDGLDLSNTNLGDIVDEWFSTKKDASKFLKQMETLINTPEEIKDVSSDLNENQINEYGKAIPFDKWESALTDFIQKNLTSDIDEVENLNDVLRNIIATNEQELASMSEEVKKVVNENIK